MPIDPNNSKRQDGHVVAFFRHFLPRSHSQIVFLLVMTGYKVVFNRIGTDIMLLGYYWKEAGESVAAGLPPMKGITVGLFVSGLLMAPVFESAIGIAVIEGLRRAHCHVAFQVVASVGLMSVLHSMPYFLSGWLIAPLFLIDVGSYLYWRRVSFWTGVRMMIGGSRSL